MKFPIRHFIGIAAAALAWTAQAQTQTPAQAQAQMQAQQAPQRQISWPEVGKEWLQEGTFVNVENLKQMGPGLMKDQIHDLLGRPHFTTGMWGVSEWDYLFNFRTGRGNEYITCQYKVLFDGDSRVENLYWRDGRCAQLLMAQQQPQVVAAPPPPPVAVAPLPPPPPPPPQPASRSVRLGADGLFRFDGGRQPDLMPEGRQRIEALIADIRREMKSVSAVTVTGHTDRIGSDAHNNALSLQRAQTVREMFIRGGLEPGIVRAVGAGKTNPVVECSGTRVTPALVSCLQPNRRVEIEVAGTL
jgi:outer membrane protein OmpA-like peptidoglycan-associated protein